MSTANFALINSFEVGASPQVCKMGKKYVPYDSRGYADALAALYPSLPLWLDGQWTEPAIAEYCIFLKAAIVQGSFPMLAVAAISVSDHRGIYQGAVITLNQKLQDRLKSLIKIGTGSEFGKYIEALDDGERKNGIHQKADREVEKGGRQKARKRNAA